MYKQYVVFMSGRVLKENDCLFLFLSLMSLRFMRELNLTVIFILSYVESK